MAKIKYFKDPIDPTQFERLESDAKTISDLLKELNIEKHPLSIELNGEIPDDLDLEIELKKDDVLVIKKPVFGGDQEDRKVIGTIIQVAALVITFASGGSLSAVSKQLIILGAAIISGVIQTIGLKKPASDTRSNEESAAVDAFSITAAQNEARPLQPMQVIMGSHRTAPDFSSNPYSNFVPNPIQDSSTSWENISLIQSANQFTTTLPANWVSNNIFNQFDWGSALTPFTTNWYPHPIKVKSGFSSANFIADAKLVNISGIGQNINYVYDYMNFTSVTPQSFVTDEGTVQGRAPTLILHDDPSDPMVVANGGPFISTLEMMCWTYFSQLEFRRTGYSGPNQQGDFQDEAHGNPQVITRFMDLYRYSVGVLLSSKTLQQFNQLIINNTAGAPSNYTGVYNLFRNKDMSSGYDNPFFLQTNENVYNGHTSHPQYDFTEASPLFGFDDVVTPALSVLETRRQNVWAYFNSLNQDLVNPPLDGRFLYTYSVPREPNLQQVKHIFSYGLGDLVIIDGKIKDTDLAVIDGNVIEDPVKNKTDWLLSNNFESNVKFSDGAELVNNTQFGGPTGLASTLPGALVNFITRETPDRCYKIEINIEGSSFKSLDDGSYDDLLAIFEIQYRVVGASQFTRENSGLIIGSNKPEAIRQTYTINLPPNKYEVRIRKRTADPQDSRDVQSFKLSGFNFFLEDDSSYVAQNRRGLRLLATGAFNGTTEFYNNLVTAKCWVYNDVANNWAWQTTRNPAWWFLYFARGGFINTTIDNFGSATYTNLKDTVSPTNGWVNSNDVSGNEERMFGGGFKTSEIDADRIIEWAEFCDTNNLACDFVFKQSQNAQEMLERIANSGRASVTYYRGKVSVIIEDPTQVPVAMFGMSNIIQDSFSVEYVTKNLPFKIIASYVDRAENWETKQVEALIPASRAPETRIDEVTLDGITEQSRAQREVNLLAARQLYQRRRTTWKAGIDGFTVKRGDLVYWSDDLTQHTYSGRCLEFVKEGGVITKIKPTMGIPEDISNLLIRIPNGQILNLTVTNEKGYLLLDAPMALRDAPENLDDCTANLESDFPRTHPEDYTIIAGFQTFVGKMIRIESVQPEENGIYAFTGIDEEPAMYSAEFDNLQAPDPDLDSRIVSRAYGPVCRNLNNGFYEICFSLEGAFMAQIKDKNTGIPLQTQSGATVFGERAVVALTEGTTYHLTIEPVVVGTAYKKVKTDITIKA